MRFDEANPENRLIVAYCRAHKPHAEPLALPESNAYAYINLGSHPDIVERIWDGLNPHLPMDCGAIVYGSPALVHPAAGIVVAMAYGTRYVLRIPDESIAAALKLGCTTEQTWAGGAKTDIGRQFGSGWLFGNWLREEPQWLVASCKRITDDYCAE